MHYKYKQNNYKYKFCRCVVCYRRCQRLQCKTNTNTNRTNTNTNQTNTNTNQTNTNQTNENQTITNTNMYIFCRCEGSYRQCQRLQCTTGFIPSPHAKLHCLVRTYLNLLLGLSFTSIRNKLFFTITLKTYKYKLPQISFLEHCDSDQPASEWTGTQNFISVARIDMSP